jgi:alginate O-acetyltransferase complex protein AlgI
MLFNSFVFLGAFLPITYLVFWSLSSARGRYIWLALTGYVFYGFWDPRFCLLMAFSTLVSYSAGRVLLDYRDPTTRKLALVIPVTVDLMLLGFFKYANFAFDTLAGFASITGIHATFPHLNVILPVGISFYTFHTITYIVDAYRGVIRPTRNLFEFAAYVSLFSQLVAGPIVRFRQIEADLENIESANRTRWLPQGVSIFVIGLVEKVVVADSLASVVDPALASYSTLSTAGTWLAMLGYTFQLYFDFCGYSDMAVGLGFMFGLRIPWNFNSPYKATDPSDFWKRWHISLSSCLRDYLYIPLGGNRRGVPRMYANLMVTMLLGGLWHGANWTFVIWGAFHGAMLVAYRVFGKQWDGLPTLVRRSVMFVLVVVGWVFFRAGSIQMATSLLRSMFSPTAGGMVPHSLPFVVMLALAALWAVAAPNAREINERLVWRPAYGFVLAPAFGAVLAIMIAGGTSPFLYFQF